MRGQTCWLLSGILLGSVLAGASAQAGPASPFGEARPQAIYLHHGVGDSAGVLLRPWKPLSGGPVPGVLRDPSCDEEPTWAAFVGADDPPAADHAHAASRTGPALGDHDHIALPAQDSWSGDQIVLRLAFDRSGAGPAGGVPAGPLRVEAALEAGWTGPDGSTHWWTQARGEAGLDAGATTLAIPLQTGSQGIMQPGIQRLAIWVHGGGPCTSLLRLPAVPAPSLDLAPGRAMLELQESGTVVVRSSFDASMAQLDIGSVWGPSVIDWAQSEVSMDGADGARIEGIPTQETPEHGNLHPWFDGKLTFVFPGEAQRGGNVTLHMVLRDRAGQELSRLEHSFAPGSRPVMCVRSACTHPAPAAASVVLPPPGAVGLALSLGAAAALRPGRAWSPWRRQPKP